MEFGKILGNIARAGLEGLREKQARMEEGYEESFGLSDEELLRRIKSHSYSVDKRWGYAKAAEERGLIRRKD
ncbi:hypothetical protein [uncultured Mitsuokella sp.]|uniref:hypothetical protein n=1 Tax=uncultured Mitsuokella sp. TaxID=453120 RepID=UPI00261A4C2F|nr:hypothetical protein [uncultured Mitsuokella sp.]